MKFFGAWQQNKFDFLSIGLIVASANCGKSTLLNEPNYSVRKNSICSGRKEVT